jgi:spore coat protein CotH
LTHHRFVLWSVLAALVVGAAPAAAQTSDDLFDDGVVHEIRLFVHADDWKSIHERYLEDTYYPCDLRWRGMTVRNVGIRSRGNGSRNERKPGMRVDVDRFVTEQRFLGLKSFVLDNVAQDPSLIRERVAMRLFARLGLPAPRVAHAVLYVNNEYAGVYALVESIDKDFLERAFSQSASEQAAALARDGYLFEFKWRYPFYFAYLGPDLGPYAELFEPKTHERTSEETLYGPLRDLCRLISESSTTDFADVVGGYLDLDQVVRYVAAENFIAEFDGLLGNWGMNNFYLVRAFDSTALRVIAWDKDNAFHASDHPIWFNTTENVLMRRALEIPRFRELYVNTLLEAARVAAEAVEGDARGWLEREFVRASRQIESAVESDRLMPHDIGAFRSEVARLIDFARLRSAFVASEVTK